MKKKLKFFAAGMAAFLTVVAATAYVDTYVIPNANILFGKNNTADKSIYFNSNAGIPGNPVIRMHSGSLEFSNDGVTFFPFSAGVPSGTIVETGLPFVPGVTPATPSGWVLTDGQSYSRTNPIYVALYAFIGTTYGIGDGSTTFNVPDLRGIQTRVPDDVSGLDPDAATRTNYVDGVFGATFTIVADSNNTSMLANLSPTDYANAAIGQGLSGGDMQSGAYVIAKTPPSTIYMSVAALGANIGETITVTNGAVMFAAGSYQSDQFASHTHPMIVSSSPWLAGGTSHTNIAFDSFGGTYPTYTTGGNQTNGKNMYVWKMIKL